MRVISLGLTCNNACVFCAQGDLSASESGPRQVDALLAEVCPGDVVALQGGEPTLRDDLPEIIEALRERRVRRIVLQTNGRRFAYRAYARRLREASDKLSLDVSLHGSTEAMHDWHTQTPESFRQTVLGARNARAEGIEFGLTTVVTRSNYRHLAEVVAVASGLGARAVHLAPVEMFGRAVGSSARVVAPMELVRPYLTRALAEARRLGLGWVVGERASEASVRELFAGLGEVFVVKPSRQTDPSGAPRRTRLVVFSSENRLGSGE